jgi:hypothetical protein
MNRVEVNLNPELLRGARERSGLSLDALARRFPKLPDWEVGEVHPTLKQLEGFAKATFTPVGYLFLQEPPGHRLLTSLAAVPEWVRGQTYRPGAMGAFLEDANYYLVAHAHAHNHVVVTHEVPSDGVQHVRISKVAIGMKLKCMTPYEMLRREPARFVLGGHA